MSTSAIRRGARRQSREGSGPHWLRAAVGPRHKLAALVVLAAVLAAAAIVGVAWAAGLVAIWHVLRHVHWVWAPVALAGEIVAYAGYTFAYRETVRAEGGAELEAPHAAALVTTGFGVFLQGGGFALDREALRRSGLGRREARSRVLGLGALEYAVLAPATAVAALVVLLHDNRISSSLTLPWLIGVPAGAAIALTTLALRGRIKRKSGWRTHLHHALDALQLVLKMVTSPQKYWLAFVGIGAYWLGDIFCLWAFLHVFAAQPPPVAQLIVGYATGYAITRRSLPLGGAGVVEALLPFALGWVGIPLARAVPAVVGYRIINLWLPMIPALAAIPAIARIESRNATS